MHRISPPTLSLRCVVTVLFAGTSLQSPLWEASAAENEPVRVMIAEAQGKVARHSEGTMVELKDGRLFLAWQEFEEGPGDSDFFPNRIVAMTSSDGGRTWNGRRVLVETAPGDTNVYSPSLLRLADGRILFCYMTYHSFEKSHNKYPPATAFARVSSDEGETFELLATLWKELPITLCNSTLRQLSTGRLVIPANRDASKKGEPDRWEAGISLSDDGGKSWRFSESWVTAPKRGAMEPHVEECRDGRLLMVMRTQAGAVYGSESRDAGLTWSNGEPLKIEAPESCPDLIREPKTGNLVLIWNASKFDPQYFSHFGKRTPLSLAVSTDDGRTWSAPRHVETDPAWAFSNPGSLFLRDGRLILNYWMSQYQPNGGMSNFPIHLKGAIIEPEWIYRGK